LRSGEVGKELRALLRTLERRDGRVPVKYILTCTLADYEQMKRDGAIPSSFELVDKKPEAADERLKLIEKKYTVVSKFHFTMQTTLGDLRAAMAHTDSPDRPVEVMRM